MTLPFALTILATWLLGSIPVSLLIVGMMQVEPDPAHGPVHGEVAVEPALREIA